MASRFRKVKPNDMVTDLAVQRRLSARRAQQLAADFNPDSLGVITVSCRKDGSFVILDGQHRMEAARLAGRGDVAVQCEIFDGLTTAQEARLFLDRNRQNAPGAQDKFRVRLTEREETAVTIEAILNEHGWRTGGTPGEGVFAAIVALEGVHKLDPDGEKGVIDRTARVITKAWGHNKVAAHGALWAGIGAVLCRYVDSIDEAKLVTILERWGPDGTLGQAHAWRATVRRHADAVAQAIVVQYNVGKRTRGLPPWI